MLQRFFVSSAPFPLSACRLCVSLDPPVSSCLLSPHCRCCLLRSLVARSPQRCPSPGFLITFNTGRPATTSVAAAAGVTSSAASRSLLGAPALPSRPAAVSRSQQGRASGCCMRQSTASKKQQQQQQSALLFLLAVALLAFCFCVPLPPPVAPDAVSASGPLSAAPSYPFVLVASAAAAAAAAPVLPAFSASLAAPSAAASLRLTASSLSAAEPHPAATSSCLSAAVAATTAAAATATAAGAAGGARQSAVSPAEESVSTPSCPLPPAGLPSVYACRACTTQVRESVCCWLSSAAASALLLLRPRTLHHSRGIREIRGSTKICACSCGCSSIIPQTARYAATYLPNTEQYYCYYYYCYPTKKKKCDRCCSSRTGSISGSSKVARDVGADRLSSESACISSGDDSQSGLCSNACDSRASCTTSFIVSRVPHTSADNNTCTAPTTTAGNSTCLCEGRPSCGIATRPASAVIRWPFPLLFFSAPTSLRVSSRSLCVHRLAKVSAARFAAAAVAAAAPGGVFLPSAVHAPTAVTTLWVAALCAAARTVAALCAGRAAAETPTLVLLLVLLHRHLHYSAVPLRPYMCRTSCRLMQASSPATCMEVASTSPISFPLCLLASRPLLSSHPSFSSSSSSCRFWSAFCLCSFATSCAARQPCPPRCPHSPTKAAAATRPPVPAAATFSPAPTGVLAARAASAARAAELLAGKAASVPAAKAAALAATRAGPLRASEAAALCSSTSAALPAVRPAALPAARPASFPATGAAARAALRAAAKAAALPAARALAVVATRAAALPAALSAARVAACLAARVAALRSCKAAALRSCRVAALRPRVAAALRAARPAPLAAARPAAPVSGRAAAFLAAVTAVARTVPSPERATRLPLISRQPRIITETTAAAAAVVPAAFCIHKFQYFRLLQCVLPCVRKSLHALLPRRAYTAGASSSSSSSFVFPYTFPCHKQKVNNVTSTRLFTRSPAPSLCVASPPASLLAAAAASGLCRGTYRCTPAAAAASLPPTTLSSSTAEGAAARAAAAAVAAAAAARLCPTTSPGAAPSRPSQGTHRYTPSAAAAASTPPATASSYTATAAAVAAACSTAGAATAAGAGRARILAAAAAAATHSLYRGTPRCTDFAARTEKVHAEEAAPASPPGAATSSGSAPAGAALRTGRSTAAVAAAVVRPSWRAQWYATSAARRKGFFAPVTAAATASLPSTIASFGSSSTAAAARAQPTSIGSRVTAVAAAFRLWQETGPYTTFAAVRRASFFVATPSAAGAAAGAAAETLAGAAAGPIEERDAMDPSPGAAAGVSAGPSSASGAGAEFAATPAGGGRDERRGKGGCSCGEAATAAAAKAASSKAADSDKAESPSNRAPGSSGADALSSRSPPAAAAGAAEKREEGEKNGATDTGAAASKKAQKKKEKEAAKAAAQAAKREAQEAEQRAAQAILQKKVSSPTGEDTFGYLPLTWKCETGPRAGAAAAAAPRVWSSLASLQQLLQQQQSKEKDGAAANKEGDEAGLEEKGPVVWVRARLQESRGKGGLAFLLLREKGATVQCVLDAKREGISREMIRWTMGLPLESIVEIEGLVVPAAVTVQAATEHSIELLPCRVYCVSAAAQVLPFQFKDADRSWEEASETTTASAGPSDTAAPRVALDTRLDHRVLDLRTAASQAVFSIVSAAACFIREFLLQHHFVEIHSPKLIAGASEGGASCFHLQYFGREACLAQSPQLYKQMAICADFPRVFEVGPVFRAENSNTHRHLCEFTGVDLEMEIRENYIEVLDLLDCLFKHVFTRLEQNCRQEIAAFHAHYPAEPFVWQEKTPRLTFAEGVQLLRAAGCSGVPDDISEFDLNTEQEKMLGRIVKDKYHTDFYMLLQYPTKVRPFYTMPSPDNPVFSNSYDFFMRTEEIISGAQRVHDAEVLTKRCVECGVPPASIRSYIDAFRLGAPPHGGAGIGLERVVMLFLGAKNIRQISMFPRDPKRLTP